VELVHKPWTTGASVHGGLASIAGGWSSLEPGLWPLRGSRPTFKRRGRGSGARGSHLGPHQRVSDDEAARRRLKARGGDEVRCERLGKEGGVGCGEIRCGRGAFYRCRGGGRRPGVGEVKAAPLMAVCAGYRKRGEAEVANKGGVREEGAAGRLLAMAWEMGGGPVRRGWGAEDGGARPACRREEDKGEAGWLGRRKAEAQWQFGTGGPKEGKGEWAGWGGRRGGPWLGRIWSRARIQKNFFSNFN
jgi:hypothetical protein